MSDIITDSGADTTLETATNWARSNREWDKVYRYLFVHPKDFFVILPGRRWPIAHQVVYHGDVDLLKRILVLADDQLDIGSKSVDNKNLLDVAKEKQTAHPAMYTYVKHLFDQDQLIREAKQKQWRTVIDLLDKKKELANEKPPYSPYFLLHYVVLYGDTGVLQDLLNRFQFRTNVLNKDNESPLDMARQLNKKDMCTILQPKTETLTNSVQKQQSTDVPPSTPVIEQQKSQQLIPGSPDVMTKSILIGFESLALGVNPSGEYTVGQPALYNSSVSAPPALPPSVQPPIHRPAPPPQSPKPSGFKHVVTRKSIISECPSPNSDPPALPSAAPTAKLIPADQIMRNFTCPLTHKVFIDPVIASDGQTYERSAILEWIQQNHNSPITGAAMNDNVRDNKDVKEIIQLMQNQN